MSRHRDDDAPGNGAAAEEPAEGGMAAADPQSTASISVEQLDTLRRERDDLRDQLLRRRAEFDNYRKRVDRERQQVRDEAAAQVLKAIIPVLDNFERALSASADAASLREGLELTRRDLLKILESEGVKTDDPVGQPFDPERHQALSHEPVPGQPDGVVVEVFRKGYVLRDRLLRPALVKVSKADDDGGTDDAIH